MSNPAVFPFLDRFPLTWDWVPAKLGRKLAFWKNIASENSNIPKWIEFGYPISFKEIPPPKRFPNHAGARFKYVKETRALIKEYVQMGALL